MPYDPKIDGNDILGFGAANASLRDHTQMLIKEQARKAQRAARNWKKSADEWKDEFDNLLARYERLDRLYLTMMDQSGAWREIAMEQAAEIQGHPFPPKGDPRRTKALEPLGSKYEKIRDRKIANRAAGKPEDY